MNHIVCKLNDVDNFSISTTTLLVNLSDKEGYRYTFFNSGHLRKLYQFDRMFLNEALDLFYISLMVYYADRKVKRSDTYDSWTREFKLYIPVLELKKWNKNRKLLERMVSYLSGDIWTFEFRQRGLNKDEHKLKKGFTRKNKKWVPDNFCMLSGGLDSFIGAIDLLEKDKNITFVGHYGGGKGVVEYQNFVIDKLSAEYNLGKNQFFNFYAAPIGGVEDTTRTRSFMFFAHAIILASGKKESKKLYIPENGLISLNIPLTNSRLGSSSTRTTHPYYMKLLQKLIDNLELEIELVNPYQFLTKGEMISQCKNDIFLKKMAAKTMSCSHPDQGRYYRETEPSHCGMCLPCVIRRSAIKSAYSRDLSKYRDKDFKGKKASIELRSYKIGILDFKRNQDKSFFKIQNSGPITDNINNYTNVYKRGMNELIKVIDKYNG